MQHAIKANRGAILRAVEQPHIKTDAPEFRPGDTVRVETKVVEGTRTRNQAFEGVVSASVLPVVVDADVGVVDDPEVAGLGLAGAGC